MQIKFLFKNKTLHRIDQVMTADQLTHLTPGEGDGVELPSPIDGGSPLYYVRLRKYRYGKAGVLGVDVELSRTRRPR